MPTACRTSPKLTARRSTARLELGDRREHLLGGRARLDAASQLDVDGAKRGLDLGALDVTERLDAVASGQRDEDGRKLPHRRRLGDLREGGRCLVEEREVLARQIGSVAPGGLLRDQAACGEATQRLLEGAIAEIR